MSEKKFRQNKSWGYQNIRLEKLSLKKSFLAFNKTDFFKYRKTEKWTLIKAHLLIPISTCFK